MSGFIICGFPGIGKTLASNRATSLVDMDERDFHGEDFPNNYVNAIQKVIGAGDTALVTVTQSVRDELRRRGLNFILMFPTIDSKPIYIDNYRRNGASEDKIAWLESNFDQLIMSCIAENPNGVSISVLTPDVYLGSILTAERPIIEAFLRAALEDYVRKYD